MTFAQRRNRLTTQFSIRISVVQGRFSVLNKGQSPHQNTS